MGIDYGYPAPGQQLKQSNTLGLAGQILPPERSRRRLHSKRGQSLVEFAMVLPLFFFLLFGAIDLGRLFYVQMTLQNAVRQAGRYAVTGNHMPDPKNPGKNLSRVDSIIQAAQQAAVGLDISSIQISSTNGGKNSAGGPGDTVTISLTTNLKLITPLISRFFTNNTYQFTVSVSFKNEPFPPGNTA
ncbi:MAG TPA: TadE/TadG family type IV pilus assembly protein [Terriglobales bacterium]|nr:TadE/TadG family type IV pilus assembly protein [Terriglobales bacterium]